MAQQPPTPSGKLRAKSYLWGICETWLGSTGGSSTWESSALPHKAPGPPKFPMCAVLLLGQCGCDMCYLSNREKSTCCSCSLLFAAGEHPWFSYRKCCAAPHKGDPGACGYQRAGTQGRYRCELWLTQTCLPCYPLLQLVSSGLRRTSSESVWQEQDQQLCASPLHHFSSQMAPTAQGFLLNLNAGGCLSALWISGGNKRGSQGISTH